MKSYLHEDGRWRHKFRQSWLKTTELCPERGRLEHLDEFEDWETDAACVGTAVHSTIEAALVALEEGDLLTQASVLERFAYEFSQQMKLPNFRWVKYSEKSALAFGAKCVAHWHREVYPTLAPGALLESTFELNLIEDDSRVIDLSGMMDYFGPPSLVARGKDWKTASRGPYAEWEYRRWDIQSTVYTLALVQKAMLEPDPEGRVPFEFVVMHEDGVQRFLVHRGEEDWNWLKSKAVSLALLIEADLPEWPKQDNHSLCSPKWCPSWMECKGKHLGPDPW